MNMAKMALQFQLPVSFIKEKKRFVAYTPVLDLSTSGKTLGEAKRRFEEASVLFFEEILRKGTFDEILDELGWQKVKKEWKPPVIVSQQSKTISVPVNA